MFQSEPTNTIASMAEGCIAERRSDPFHSGQKTGKNTHFSAPRGFRKRDFPEMAHACPQKPAQAASSSEPNVAALRSRWRVPG